MSTLVHLHLVESMHLTRYLLKDGTNGYRVCIMAREYTNGENRKRLESCLPRIIMRALCHCNHSYADAKIL